MAEAIIPGTYITVRPEGLISAGRVATGIIGIVGTASRGAIGIAQTVSGFAEARELFGPSDDFDRPRDGAIPLTLMRALDQSYNNGASTVVAVRVASDNSSHSTYSVQDNFGNSVAVLSASTPGTWGNDIRVQVAAAEEDCRIDDETHTESFDDLNCAPVVPSLENRIRIYRGITKQLGPPLNIVYKLVFKEEQVTPNSESRYFLAHTPVVEVANVNLVRVLDSEGTVVYTFGDGDISYAEDTAPTPDPDKIGIIRSTGEIIFGTEVTPEAGHSVVATYAVDHADPNPGEVLVTTWNGALQFAPNEAPQQADGDKLIASYVVSQDSCVFVSLTYEEVTEPYTVPDGHVLAARINAGSGIATAEADDTYGGNTPALLDLSYFGTGSNTPGNDGADSGEDEYKTGLAGLANELVNIVLLAGQDAATMGSVLQGHLNTAKETDHERIGLLGAPGEEISAYLGHSISSDRMILVAPGIAYHDGRTLPAAYTAAAVAGLMSSIPVQTSLTNRAITLPGVTLKFNRGQQEQLIKHNVLAVVEKFGYRLLKGITTSGEGTPFSAIPTRRIVDYAKYGVRSAADPYIGRLNNARVRAALKATLDGFLTRMVDDEQLTGYELEVTATRSQEIAGEVSVVMTLQPTFSIDFIKVTMVLK